MTGKTSYIRDVRQDVFLTKKLFMRMDENQI
jgi:hypothetical protein